MWLYFISMHTPHFFFFCQCPFTCCLFYIYFRLQKLLDKKQVKTVFLFEFKISHKVVETTHNINNAFGSGPANELTVQWWFKRCYKGDKSLGDEEHSDWPSEIDNYQLRAIMKLVFLQPYEMLPKNSTNTILQSFSI